MGLGLDRRQMLGAGLGLGTAMAAAAAADAGDSQALAAGWRERNSGIADADGLAVKASDFGIRPNSGNNESKPLQLALDAAATQERPLLLAPGIYKAADIEFRDGAKLIGVPGATILEYTGGRSLLSATDASRLRLEGLVLDGADLPVSDAGGLLAAVDCAGIVLRDLSVRLSNGHGITLTRVSGSIKDCAISHVAGSGIRSIDAAGLEIAHNTVTDCADNGIQVWRSTPGEDGTIVMANRIARINARSGGSGQNGNAINVFRAGSVLVSNNRITDCAYSAIRGNAASNIQIIANSCARLGEVALYAEFGFEGALIANNLVDDAASGIAVTNFNEGGRLAVIQGNIIRNLKRREFEPVDKRGDGIGVEADAVVTGNVIENAPTAGIAIGWGRYMRDVSVTNNLIRNPRIGITVTSDPAAGACVIASNMICGAAMSAIRAMDHGRPVGVDLAAPGAAGNWSGAESSNIRVLGNIAL